MLREFRNKTGIVCWHWGIIPSVSTLSLRLLNERSGVTHAKMSANQPNPSAKNDKGDSRPFTREDFQKLLRKAVHSPSQKLSPKSQGK
jgi:hypothetical protein